VEGSIVVFLNPHAGRNAAAPDADTLRQAFARHGLDVRVLVLTSKEDAQALFEDALEGDVHCVVAAGGDGTINAVAQRVAGHPHTTLGILPLGTLNHFARDLGIPTDLDKAVRTIVAGRHASVDIGDVNGSIFLNNASIGLYATILAHRERERRHLHLGKWPAMAKATWAALRDPASFDVAIDVDGHDEHWRTPVLFVGNNDYTVQGPALGQRKRLDEGALSIYALRPKGRWGLLWLGLRALMGRVSGRDDLDARRATELVVHAAPRSVTVARDGELATFETPLRFRIRPRALLVHVPDNNLGTEA
jgi:YegS/Rv2252/BmrU family lipid kinase